MTTVPDLFTLQGLSDTQLFQLMHGLAADIAQAKQANDPAAVLAAYTSFKTVAGLYVQRGTAEQAQYDFIRSVEEGAEAVIGGLGKAAGDLAGGLLGPFLVPLVIVAGVVGLYILWRAGLLPKGKGA